MPTLLALVADVSRLEIVVVVRQSADGSHWTVCAAHGDVPDGFRIGGQFKGAPALLSQSLASDKADLVDDLARHPMYVDHQSPYGLRFRGYGAVPIRLKSGQIFGLLCAVSRQPQALDDRAVRITFERVAQIIATSIPAQESFNLTRRGLREKTLQGRRRDRFIAVLGHDLRAPIAAIVANTALLKRHQDGASLLKLGERIRASAARMETMVDDMLDLARTQFGTGIDLRLERVSDLGEALSQVVSELQEPAPERQIDRDIRIDVAFDCDRGRLQQLTSNLLANALVHGSRDTPVGIKADIINGHLRIAVTNRGNPIDPRRLTRVFEAFSRPSGRTRQDGLGLGLHICAEIAKAHGGVLRVASSEADGTTFTALIPFSVD